MTTEVQEELKVINDAIKEVANFVQTDATVKPDFDEYIRTISGGRPQSINFQSACFNYIFERYLGEERKSIFELYLANTKKLPAETKKVIKALQKSVSSVFEVKKVHRTGFELDNIINEKLYNVTSLVKMTSFRGIGPGQFVVARIFKYNKEHYLLEISGVLSSSKRDDALRFSVAKIIQNPELVYMDNPEKLKEVFGKYVKEMRILSNNNVTSSSTDNSKIAVLAQTLGTLTGMWFNMNDEYNSSIRNGSTKSEAQKDARLRGINKFFRMTVQVIISGSLNSLFFKQYNNSIGKAGAIVAVSTILTDMTSRFLSGMPNKKMTKEELENYQKEHKESTLAWYYKMIDKLAS